MLPVGAIDVNMRFLWCRSLGLQSNVIVSDRRLKYQRYSCCFVVPVPSVMAQLGSRAPAPGQSSQRPSRELRQSLKYESVVALSKRVRRAKVSFVRCMLVLARMVDAGSDDVVG
jgi:hypothetical protein